MVQALVQERRDGVFGTFAKDFELARLQEERDRHSTSLRAFGFVLLQQDEVRRGESTDLLGLDGVVCQGAGELRLSDKHTPVKPPVVNGVK